MEELLCNWTPTLIVDLVKNVAWPLVVLILGIGLRNRIFEIFRSFFTRNTVSEVIASTSGFSAKFVAAEKQTSEVFESGGSSAMSLPRNMSAAAIRERHQQYGSEFTEYLHEAIVAHLSVLGVGDDEKVELLAREVALLQAFAHYADVSKVLFRSQFNLFSIMASNNGCISKEDAFRNFEAVKEVVSGALSEWDLIKFIAFPVSKGLMYEEEGSYRLTTFGSSYVAYMAKNPHLIDELAKL
nr:hypothetical protein [Pseudomonas toyotomiensis]